MHEYFFVEIDIRSLDNIDNEFQMLGEKKSMQSSRRKKIFEEVYCILCNIIVY